MKILGFLVCCAGCVLSSSAASVAHAAYGAIFRVSAADAEFRLRGYTVNRDTSWVAREAIGGDRPDKDGKREVLVRTGQGAKGNARGFCRFADDPAGGVRAEWQVVPGEDAKIAVLEVRGTFPLEEFASGALVADGRRVDIPYEDAKGNLFEGQVRALSLVSRHGPEALKLTFPKEQQLTVTRTGDPKIGGRLILCLRMAFAPKPGDVQSLSFTADTPDGLRMGADADYRISGGGDWVPFQNASFIVPGSALDFSAMRPTGSRAGEFGRVRANGDHFELAGRPGVPVRFCGINVGMQSFLHPVKTLEEAKFEAEVLADRLSRMGYNTVLFEKIASCLVSRDDCTRPTELGMAKIDALVNAFVSRGIYIALYLDDYRFWLMRWRDCGIDRDGCLSGGDWKSLIQVHEGVVSNTMAYARNFFLHRNRYTGRTLAEEPGLGWISLVGEGCLGSNTARLEKEESWRTAWREFLAARRRADPDGWRDIPEAFPKSVSEPTRHAVAFKLFLDERERLFGERMRKFIREDLKCGALVSNMNGVFYPIHIRKSRTGTYDYVDEHCYWDHPDYFGIDWKPPATAGTASPVCNALGIMAPWIDREFGKPFVVTEWNFCPPNPCRGIAGLLMGAQAAYQDWAGIWRFATTMEARLFIQPESAFMESFNMTGDPLFRASERATACLYVRGDMPVAKRTFVREIPDTVFAKPVDGAPNEDVWHWLNWTAWYGRIGSWTDHPAGTLPKGGERLCLYPKDYGKKDLDRVSRLVAGIGANEPLSPACDGAARLDRERGSLFIETHRTCGGFVTKGGFTAGVLTLAGAKTPTAAWASALDDAGLDATKRILVSHLVDCVNTDMTFTDETRRMLLKWGHAPQLVRRTSARVSLEVAPGTWTVWAIHEDGTRRFRVPSSFADGRLTFEANTAGRDGKAVLQYELVR